VTGIRNITGGGDIISDDMRLLASEDEDEFAEVSKAAPPVNAQNSDNHAGDVKGQEMEEVEEIRRYPLWTVHRHRYGIFSLTQLILQTRQLSSRL
jgi:hypothetical protein